MGIITSLQDFVTKTGAKGRITFGDVRRLQRDVLPDGVSSREQVDLLLSLDADVARADCSWAEWLVPAVLDFVVWGEEPAGEVEGETAQWLKDRLAAGGALTKAARRIAREIRRETDRVEEPAAVMPADEEITVEVIAVPETVEAATAPMELAA